MFFGAVFEKEKVFLEGFDLIFHFLYGFFVGAEVEFDVVGFAEGFVYDVFLDGGHLVVEVVLGVFEGLFLEGEFVVEGLD